MKFNLVVPQQIFIADLCFIESNQSLDSPAHPFCFLAFHVWVMKLWERLKCHKNKSLWPHTWILWLFIIKMCPDFIFHFSFTKAPLNLVHWCSLNGMCVAIQKGVTVTYICLTLSVENLAYDYIEQSGTWVPGYKFQVRRLNERIFSCIQ